MALSTGTNSTQPVGTTLPSSRELEGELTRTRRLSAYVRVVRNTIFTLVTVAAVAVLVATLLMPVLQIYGTSMSPTLEGPPPTWSSSNTSAECQSSMSVRSTASRR